MPSHQLEDQNMEIITSPYAEYNEHARGTNPSELFRENWKPDFEALSFSGIS